MGNLDETDLLFGPIGTAIAIFLAILVLQVGGTWFRESGKLPAERWEIVALFFGKAVLHDAKYYTALVKAKDSGLGPITQLIELCCSRSRASHRIPPH